MVLPVSIEERSIRGNVITKKSIFTDTNTNIHTILTEYKETIINYIRTEAALLNNYVKWYLAAHISFKKLVDSVSVTCTGVFRSKNQLLSLYDDDIGEQYSTCYEKIVESIERDGSGWVENGVEFLEVGITKYVPLFGTSFIPTPSKLKKTNSIVNVQNMDDEKCFLWSVLAAVHPIASNPYRVTK